MLSHLNIALLLLLLSPFTAHSEAPITRNTSHIDELKVNANLQLNEVLAKTILRNPMQATLQALESTINAKQLIAKSILPSSPAISLAHQNDKLGTGRGEREWQADLEIPVWLPNQRDNRLKVANATQLNVSANRESLKLRVAGLLRDAVWDISMNENHVALAKNKLHIAKKLLLDVEKRYQAGEMAKTDAMLAQQETLRAEKEQLRAEAELMHAKNRYYLLTGLREIPASFEEKQSSLEDYSQSSIWTEAQSKLSLAETERNLAQVESRENLQVLFNIRSTQGAFDSMSNESVGVKVRIPFGGEARAAPIKAAAELGVGNALSEQETLRNVLETMMHEAEHNLHVSQAELAIAGKQYEIANESIRLAEKSFQLGESDLVSLLRVKALTYEAERAFTTRKIQVQWDIARYNQAVGVLP